MTLTKSKRLTAITIAVVTLWACHGGDCYEGQRTAEERQQYQALNDSMAHMTPRALTLIGKAMNDAKDSLTWYDYYLLYGRHYLLTEHPDSLLPYAERTLRFVQDVKPQTPRTRGLTAWALSAKAAYLYLMHHDADSIIGLYQRAYDLMMESDMKENLPDLSANLGDVYVAKDDMPEGARWYRRALFLADSLKLPASQNLTLYMGLGRIYTTLKDFEQAREYYEMADERFDEMKPNMQSYFLNNYGNYFYYNRQYDEALKMFMRLKRHIEQYNAENNFDMYLCKINLADVYLNLGKADSASYYVREPETYFEKHGVDIGTYYAHTIRIGIALLQKQYGEIGKILREEGDLHVTDNNMLGIRQRYMSRYYANVGDYHVAYNELRDNTHRRDSAESHTRQLRASDIMIQLTEDTLRLHHQLAMKEREASYARIRSTLWGFVALLIIVTLLFVLRLNYERKRRLQTHLDILTLRLSNARQRISPHFVFNVLNSRMSKTDQQEGDQLLTLARLIRSNLDLTTQTYVTLAEELDFVRQYVEVERSLIGEDFTFSIEAPGREKLERVVLPSMLIQIMTENAIIHGLKNREGEKRLLISVVQDDKDTRISVIDNGPGFDIRKASERTRTGLSIIRTTLAAVNEQNKKSKMRYDVANDNGCHATLIIPYDLKLPESKSPAERKH